MRLIKRRSLWLLILLIPVYGPAAAATKARPGRAPSPALDREGRLAVLYVDGREGLKLAGIGEPDETVVVPPLAGRAVLSPLLRADRAGGLWAAWIQEDGDKSEILTARVSGRKAVGLRRVRTFPGTCHSLSLDFSPRGDLWLAWAQYDGTYLISASNVTRGKMWTVSGPSGLPSSSVQVLIDGNGRPWLFWTGQVMGRDAVLSSSFDGVRWSPPRSLSGRDSSFALFPCAFLDAEGLPRVLWSAHDGEDHEIFSASRTAAGWSSPERLTDNDQDDLAPSAALAGNSPVIVWSRPGAKGARLLARMLGRAAGPETVIAERPDGYIQNCRLSTSDALAAFVWEGSLGFESEVVSLDRLLRPSIPQVLAKTPPAPAAPRSDDAWIGFGDSITYGTIDGEEVPERGYLPRLEALMESFYGPTEMINEGWPGEQTVNGMGRMDEVLAIRRARYMLFMEGTNDIIFIGTSMEAVAFHIEQIIIKCRRAGVFPTISTIIPRNDWRWAKKYYRDRISSLNTYIRKIAENTRVPLVDQFNAFYEYPEADGGWTTLISDGVHPTDKGYEVMTRTWFDGIRILPFPPAYLAVKRTTERSLFSVRNVNAVSWQPNAKLALPAVYKSILIYRREAKSSPGKFKLLASLPVSPFHVPQSYLDLAIQDTLSYEYAVALLRLDGVEGPLSESAKD